MWERGGCALCRNVFGPLFLEFLDPPPIFTIILFCLYLWVQVFGPCRLETLNSRALRTESRDVWISSNEMSSMSRGMWLLPLKCAETALCLEEEVGLSTGRQVFVETVFKSPFCLSFAGADLGGGCRGVHTPPPSS